MAIILILLTLLTSTNNLANLPSDDEDDYLYSEDITMDDPVEKEVVSLDKPDFVSKGGIVAVNEGGKVVLPCQVNGLGGRQVGK